MPPSAVDNSPLSPLPHSVTSDDPCGVFCALSILLIQLQHVGWVDVFQTVRELRRQRPALITRQVCLSVCLYSLGTARCHSSP